MPLPCPSRIPYTAENHCILCTYPHAPLAQVFLKASTVCFYLYLRYPACEPSYSRHQQSYFESMSDCMGVCRRPPPILAIFRSVCHAGKCVDCCSLDLRAVQRFGPSSQECVYFLLFPGTHLFLTVSVILPHPLGTLEQNTQRSINPKLLNVAFNPFVSSGPRSPFQSQSTRLPSSGLFGWPSSHPLVSGSTGNTALRTLDLGLNASSTLAGCVTFYSLSLKHLICKLGICK